MRCLGQETTCKDSKDVVSDAGFPLAASLRLF